MEKSLFHCPSTSARHGVMWSGGFVAIKHDALYIYMLPAII